MENARVKNQAGNRKKAKHCKFEISVSFNECWLKNNYRFSLNKKAIIFSKGT
jgi:hypothetical protein